MKRTLPCFTKEALLLKQEFLGFYANYIQFSIVFWITEILGSFLIKTRDPSASAWQVFITAISRLSNLGKVLSPLALLFIRTRDPLLDSEMRRVAARVIGYFPCFSKKENSEAQENELDHIITPDFMQTEDGNSTKNENNEIKMIMRFNDYNKDDAEQMWFNLIPERFKQYLVRTVISFVGNVYHKRVSSKCNDYEHE